MREETAAAVDHEALVQVEAWLDQGLYLQAQSRLDALEQLDSPEAGLCVVRLLRGLGAERAGDARALRLGRRFPTHAEALTCMLRTQLMNKGTYAYWRLAARAPVPAQATPAERAQALSLRAVWLAELRDFSEAHKLHEEALALDACDPWLQVEYSRTLAGEDRYAEALAVARHALALAPGYRAALQQIAHLQVLLGQRAEAMALLGEALHSTQSAALAHQLQMLQHDEAQHEAGLRSLDLAERWQPLAEKNAKARIAARRADALMALGRWDEAREQAAQVPGTGFYSQLAQRLASTPTGAQRVLLQVEFVRQHFATCAPATMASLCGFWGWPAEHLEIAQAICYDGTPEVSERLWCERQGLLTQEFRLDWTSACALIDAGVPFGLVTQYAGGAHLQAVVGYDGLRGTLLVRDPYQPIHAEFEAAALFDAQKASGPRAMLMLPPAQAHRIAGIELPEVESWTRLHRLQAALERHDRGAAQAQLAEMRALDTETRLRWRAERVLALYDGDESGILAATEALLERFPDDTHLQLSKAVSLAALRGPQVSEAYLSSLAARPNPEPLLLARLAGRLADDSRRLPQAFALMRRALRRAPGQSSLWMQWANLGWQQGRSDEGLLPYRWAATLQRTDEDAAQVYARLCRVQGHVEQGLDFLRARVAQLGGSSGAPALTLAAQLSQMERQQEADAALDAALARRPDDAELKLQVAELQLRLQRLDAAQALLDAATQPTHQAGLMRVLGLLAEARGEFEQALASAQQAVALEPLRPLHHRLVVRLLDRREGRAAALAWLQAQADQHPAHYGLQSLLYQWLPDEPELINAQLTRIAAAHPFDPWLRRELATQASRQGRHDEAVVLAQRACDGAPERADSHGTLGYAVLRRDGYAAALPHLQQSVALDVDYDYALRTLIGEAPDPLQARAAVDFVAAELLRQVTIGDGVLNMQAEAGRLMPAAELEALLQRALAARPELWHCWVALGQQQVAMDQADAALRTLQQAAERFDSLPRLQVELAEALRLLGRRDEALQATAKALALSPGWGRAVRLHVDLLNLRGADGAENEAEATIRRALLREPQDDDLLGLLAWQLERQQRGDEALAEARRSLLLNPRPSWVWSIARRACEVAERLSDFDALLDEVQQSRPGDAWAWAVCAGQHRDDRVALAAAERALRLEPRLEAAWLARFERLARLARHEEIEQLLVDMPWPGSPPVGLRAWGPRCAWRREAHQEAVQRMRALLAEAPHDEDLWRDLADWLDTRDDNEGYLEAAQQMLRLAPSRSLTQTYVGHALLKLKRPAEAIAPLRRALEINPAYTFAARRLAEAAAETGQADQAEWALSTLWAHEQGVAIAAQGVQAACKAGHREQALQWLDRLAHCDEYDITHCQAAAEALRDAGWGEALEAAQLALIERGEGPSGPPGLVMDWLQQEERRRGWFRTLYRLRALMRRTRGPCLQLAALRWLYTAGHVRSLQWFVSRHAAALCADETSWGDVSYTLLQLGRSRDVRRWMSDWREHPQAPIWALGNLCLAHCKAGDWTEIDAVLAVGLPRAPYNEDLRLWQLASHALGGRMEALTQGLERLHEWTPDRWMIPLVDALRGFVELARQRAGGGTVRAFQCVALRISDATALRLYIQLRKRLVWRHTPWTQLWRWLI